VDSGWGTLCAVFLRLVSPSALTGVWQVWLTVSCLLRLTGGFGVNSSREEIDVTLSSALCVVVSILNSLRGVIDLISILAFKVKTQSHLKKKRKKKRKERRLFIYKKERSTDLCYNMGKP